MFLRNVGTDLQVHTSLQPEDHCDILFAGITSNLTTLTLYSAFSVWKKQVYKALSIERPIVSEMSVYHSDGSGPLTCPEDEEERCDLFNITSVVRVVKLKQVAVDWECSSNWDTKNCPNLISF